MSVCKLGSSKPCRSADKSPYGRHAHAPRHSSRSSAHNAAPRNPTRRSVVAAANMSWGRRYDAHWDLLTAYVPSELDLTSHAPDSVSVQIWKKKVNYTSRYIHYIKDGIIINFHLIVSEESRYLCVVSRCTRPGDRRSDSCAQFASESVSASVCGNPHH